MLEKLLEVVGVVAVLAIAGGLTAAIVLFILGIVDSLPMP